MQSMFKDQILPNPENWVWKMENSNLIPHWTDLFEATVALRDLTKYSCKPEKVAEDVESVCSRSCCAQNCVAAREIVKENKGYFITTNNFFFCYLKHMQVDIILFFSKMIVESR